MLCKNSIRARPNDERLAKIWEKGQIPLHLKEKVLLGGGGRGDNMLEQNELTIFIQEQSAYKEQQSKCSMGQRSTAKHWDVYLAFSKW